MDLLYSSVPVRSHDSETVSQNAQYQDLRAANWHLSIIKCNCSYCDMLKKKAYTLLMQSIQVSLFQNWAASFSIVLFLEAHLCNLCDKHYSHYAFKTFWGSRYHAEREDSLFFMQKNVFFENVHKKAEGRFYLTLKKWTNSSFWLSSGVYLYLSNPVA